MGTPQIYKIDLAAKKRKKHKNQISGLEYSMFLSGSGVRGKKFGA
jgi:hypothetical protein